MGVEDKQADKFRRAVIKGDVTLMRKILRKGGLLTYHDKLGRNWLHIAALHSQEKSFSFLLESGMDPALSDQQNWTPLHAACSVGHCEIADLLIDAYQRRRILYKKINQVDTIHFTPLHLACVSGNCSLVRALVRKGADLTLKDDNGRTPHDICVEKKNKELAKTLEQSNQEHGARTSQHGSALACALKGDKLGDVVEALVGGLNLNTKTAHDQSLLFIAACSGSKDTTACLIGKGADINIANAYGRTIIHQLITEGFDSMIKFFLSQPSIDLLHKDHMGRNVLHAAAEWGRHAYLTDLVKQGAKLDDSDKLGFLPIHLAAKFGRSKAVQVLVDDLHVDVNVRDSHGRTPLHHAVWSQKIRIVTLLVERGADCNAEDKDGVTPLLMCVEKRFSSAIDLLLSHKADPFHQHPTLSTPLMSLVKWKPPSFPPTEGCLLVEVSGNYVEKPLFAANRKAHLKIAKALIARMCLRHEPHALDQRDKEDRSALHWSIIHRHEEVSMCLILSGADVEAKDVRGSTPFTVCEQSLYPSKIRQRLLAAVDERKAAMDAESEDHNIHHLFEIAANNDVDGLVELLTSDESLIAKIPGFRDEDGQTLFHTSASHGSYEIYKILLKNCDKAKLSLHKCNPQGQIPLHLAAEHNHGRLCKLLIQSGSDVNAQDSQGSTPLDLATKEDVKSLLQKAVAEFNTTHLFASLEEEDIEAALTYIDHGINLEGRDEYGSTPLIVAAVHGQNDVLIALLKRGAKVDAVDDNMQSALHWAAMKGNDLCVEQLVKYNSPLNGLDAALEQTPMHWAVTKGHDRTALQLARAGADLSIKDASGSTALDYASPELRPVLESLRVSSRPRDVQTCNEDLFALLEEPDTIAEQVASLLDEGAELEALDEHESTPLCAATITDLPDVVKLLIARGCNIEPLDDNGQTPLHWAAIEGHCSVGQLLIAAKANVNREDPRGQTPLHWAVLQSRVDFVRLLMRSNANAEQRDEDNETPLTVARGEIKEILEEFMRVPEVLTPRSRSRQENQNGNENKEHIKSEVSTEMKNSISEMIHAAIESSDVRGQCQDPARTEEAIISSVDRILDHVQQRAEQALDRTLERLDGTEAFPADE